MTKRWLYLLLAMCAYFAAQVPRVAWKIAAQGMEVGVTPVPPVPADWSK
jgi:hypothetical protein